MTMVAAVAAVAAEETLPCVYEARTRRHYDHLRTTTPRAARPLFSETQMHWFSSSVLSLSGFPFLAYDSRWFCFVYESNLFPHRKRVTTQIILS
jgi:hypothetical protein